MYKVIKTGDKFSVIQDAPFELMVKDLSQKDAGIWLKFYNGEISQSEMFRRFKGFSLEKNKKPKRITAAQFMEFFRSEDYNEMSEEDTKEIFKTCLKGGSVLEDGKLIEGVLKEYSVVLLEYTKAENEDKISIVWCIEDVIVQAEKDGNEVTKEEARKILKNIKRKHDAENGVNWITVSCEIEAFIIDERDA